MVTPRTVRSIRSRFSLSQRKFAALLGVSHATVARWEIDSLPVSPYHLRLLILLKKVSKDRLQFKGWRLLLDNSKGLKAFLLLVE